MSGPRSTPEWREPIALLPAALPPLRKHIVAYLEYKRNRTTEATQRGYRSVLTNFERHYSTLELSAFEGHAGTILVLTACQVTLFAKAFPLSVRGAFA